MFQDAMDVMEIQSKDHMQAGEIQGAQTILSLNRDQKHIPPLHTRAHTSHLPSAW